MTVRRYILQSRGREEAQGHRAETLVLAAPQETPMSSPSLTLTLSDTSVRHTSAGRSSPSCPRYLLLMPDHPPPR